MKKVLSGLGSHGLTDYSVGTLSTNSFASALYQPSEYSQQAFLVKATSRKAELLDASSSLRFFNEATQIEPLLGAWGTRANMGVFSNGEDNLISLSDTLSSISGSTSSDGASSVALWCQGVTGATTQFPIYMETRQILKNYEELYANNDYAVIQGIQHTAATYEHLYEGYWGLYSQAYIGMATLINSATGNPVDVWGFIQGYKSTSFFYKYELPILIELEQKGIVRVHFAKNYDSRWYVPTDWYNGTTNIPPPRIT